MIFITAQFKVRPEHADSWPEITRDFTEAVNAEPGCLWFFWSRALKDPNTYVLVEAFRDDEAGVAHVQAEHTQKAFKGLPAYLQETPKIVNVNVPQDGWSELGEMKVS